eukprot:1157319-Pelagomonas_calceolata.AAC.17
MDEEVGLRCVVGRESGKYSHLFYCKLEREHADACTSVWWNSTFNCNSNWVKLAQGKILTSHSRGELQGRKPVLIPLALETSKREACASQKAACVQERFPD